MLCSQLKISNLVNLVSTLRTSPRREIFAAATASKKMTESEVCVPRVITTPNFQLKLLDSQTTRMSNFDNILAWMEKNDSYFASYKKTSLADLLETPEIVNNQSSSFTKTLYAMKGFARDFAHLRIKSNYDYPEVSESIRLGKGQMRERGGNFLYLFLKFRD